MPGWVRDARGVRTFVRPEGIVIGSGPSCAVVLPGPEVSERQAVLLRGPSGTEVVVVAGRAPFTNGRRASEREVLANGDVIVFGGAELVHEWEPEPPSEDWLVEIGGRKFAVVRSPFVIGGDEKDDLVVATLPAGAITLYFADGSLVLEPAIPVVVSGRETEQHVTVRDRDVIVAGDTRLRVRRRTRAEATTIGERARPARVRLELLPNGGLLTVEHGVTRAVWLADRRCDLVAALLRPPSGIRAGELVPDDKLLRLVWPNDAPTRVDLNTLIYRVRQTLTRAGLDGAALIQRPPSGGGARFVLAEGAEVDVNG